MAEQTNLPSIPPPNENNLVAFARAVKEALEVRLGRRGQGLDAMVTFRDLDKVQMVQGDGRGGVVGLRPPAAIGTVSGGYDPTLDTTPPPAPQNVKASGAVRNVILEWDGPPSTYRNHAYAEIWRSSTNNLNDAAQIGQSGSTMYVDNVGEGQTRYYWVRFVSQANVTGPWHAAGDGGAQAGTALDVDYTLGLIEGRITETHLFESLGARINLIDSPSTVNGSVNARISGVQVQIDTINAELATISQTPAYDEGATYAATDLVTYEGGLYRALQETTGNLPTNATYWEKVGDYASLGEAVAAHAAQLADHETRVTSAEGAITAEAAARTLLAAQVGTNTAAIQAEAQTRATETGALATQITTVVANYQAADAATLTSAEGYADAAAAGALTSAQAAIQAEATARADADGALAESINTVSTTVDGNTSAIQTQATAIDGLSAQYTIKVQAGGISGGIGLAAEAADGSDGVIDLAVRANRFYVAPPEGLGDTKTALFTHYATPTEINGVEIPAGTYMDAAFMRTFVAQKGQIGALAVDDAAIENVTAGKLKSGAINADIEITAGQRLKISGEGWIESYSTPNFSKSGDYSRLDAGNIQLFRYVPAINSVVLYNYLSRLESGVGANNVEVTLPGYWRSQPKIMVSPAVLSLYRHDYANQSQAIRCEAINIQETGVGTMQYKFTPRAQLELAAATGAATINVSASSSSNSWTSATYTTPANTSSVTLNVDVGSVRGTGTSGSYYYRQVAWRVMYLSGGSWVASTWQTKTIGATVGQVADTRTFSFPSAAAWQFYIEYSASDAGGTFTTGAPQYDNYLIEYLDATSPAPGDYKSATAYAHFGETSTNSVSFIFPEYTPSLSGNHVYEVVYSWEASYYLRIFNSGTNNSFLARASVSGGPDAIARYFSLDRNEEVEEGSISIYASYAKTATSHSATPVNLTVEAYVPSAASGVTSYAQVRTKNVRAAIKSRRLVTNSTTPSNSALFKSYSYSLSSALVLATGQLNWLAVGE